MSPMSLLGSKSPWRLALRGVRCKDAEVEAIPKKVTVVSFRYAPQGLAVKDSVLRIRLVDFGHNQDEERGPSSEWELSLSGARERVVVLVDMSLGLVHAEHVVDD